MTDKLRERIRKLYVLVTEGATDGERAAAKARLDAILGSNKVTYLESQLYKLDYEIPAVVPPGAQMAFVHAVHRIAMANNGVTLVSRPRTGGVRVQIIALGVNPHVISFLADQVANRAAEALKERGIWKMVAKVSFLTGYYNAIQPDVTAENKTAIKIVMDDLRASHPGLTTTKDLQHPGSEFYKQQGLETGRDSQPVHGVSNGKFLA